MVRIARQTGTAVVVVRDGKLVEERQAAPEPAAPKPLSGRQGMALADINSEDRLVQ